MSIRNLDQLLSPASVAVIGASDRAQSLGATVMQNLLAGGFKGPVWPVNPKREQVAGQRAYANVASLPQAPDLALVCTPAATVPGLITALGERGTRAAVVLTAGMSAPADPGSPGGPSLRQAMLDAARPHLLRILGPNCVGLLVPGIGLNASFAHSAARPGQLAFVSQSGTLTTALLDWAKSRDIGFSHFVSLGDCADVDFGDMLDYLGSDPGTRAILMYIESVTAARKFMSAARAAARNKPVLLVKAGRAPAGAKAAASHTGALAGSDIVFDAAVRRAGMLRVATLADLFTAAETLARAKPFRGDELAIMTNGGGAAVLAADALALGGGKMAALSAESLQAMDAFLPDTWSKANPVDIIGDAPIERYVQTLSVLLKDPSAQALLFMHAPTAIVPSADIARAVVPMMQAARQPVLGCWLGGDAVAEARRIFVDAGIPSHDTPEQAVAAFLQLADFHCHQALLTQTPDSVPREFTPDRAAARRIIDDALADGQSLLSESQAKNLLAAYGVPVVATHVVSNVDAADKAARQLGFPAVLKILSPDISHKSDVGGVALNLPSSKALRAAAQHMLQRVRESAPEARLEGFTVQAMVRRPGAFELIVGMSTDPVFGPVILFGQGGVAVEVIADRAVALPPLNLPLARDLVSRTRVARLLAGYRDRPPIAHDALHLVLMQVSQLVCDCPEVAELDINPLLADGQGVVALDARVKLAPVGSVAEGVAGAAAGASGQDSASRLAIRPYPVELEETATLAEQDLLLRPIRPEDEPRLKAFFTAARPQDLRLRFFQARRELAHSELARYSQLDYDREMAFIALAQGGLGQAQVSGERAGQDMDAQAPMLGDVRVSTDPDNLRAEFALMVAADWQRRGLGRLLMNKMIAYLRQRGTATLVGECLRDNLGMRALALDLGFKVKLSDDGRSMALTLALLAS